ncbi:hypothetical protein HZC07_01265 [Candidatus Micrarchaeota archaeon]|nr:hypothetical protein [Candidatus Micrarchaeota archaeon]
MNNFKKSDKIRMKNQHPPREDIEKLKKELLSNELRDEEIINVGENRGQLFVRLPTRITTRIGIKKGDKLRIIAEGIGKNVKINLEVVSDGTGSH